MHLLQISATIEVICTHARKKQHRILHWNDFDSETRKEFKLFSDKN